MSSRRNFLKNGSILLAGLSVSNIFDLKAGILQPDQNEFINKRPAVKDRKFISRAVEAEITRVKARIADPELAWMFENCFPNTLDTTISHFTKNGKPDTFVITGDINAMWLRDSSAQVWPYIPFAKDDAELSLLIQGVINRQAKCVLIDPYANAFNYGPDGSYWISDETAMKPELHERKWEVDSLCYVIRLGHQFWKLSGNTDPFDKEWESAMRLIVKTFKEQQRKEGNGPYSFRRKTTSPNDTAQGTGFGNPVRPVGLICSVFRPSDDGAIFPFLVPSNFFAVQSLRQLAEMSEAILKDKDFAAECGALADEVYTALQKYAIVDHFEFGKVYAYEVDGYGSRLHMDDANVPSLISLPYIAGLDPAGEVYQNTRKLSLSPFNPYFAEGKYKGVGGPHTGKEMIWPLSYVMRAMTSHDDEEIRYCLQMLKETHAGTGFMHESFDKNNPSNFTRSWFAWANTIFGELILKIADEKPHLLR
ncbi:MAG: glycoside hydrolase family 125 protein [Bacteroidales bacterium]|nr:glycoside hydrolase family 125 protein [Bacteroidales bacterium]